MRISDWSSDVCSSDLRCAGAFERFTAENRLDRRALVAEDKWCARCARPDAALADRSDRKRPLVYAGERSGTDLSRSEERRVGQERVSTCRSRGASDHEKKKNSNTQPTL